MAQEIPSDAEQGQAMMVKEEDYRTDGGTVARLEGSSLSYIKPLKEARSGDGWRWIEPRTETPELEALERRRRPGICTEPWQVVNTNSWLGDFYNPWLGDSKDTSFRPWRDPRRAIWPDDLQTLQKLLVFKKRKASQERIIKQYRNALPPGVPNNWQDFLAKTAQSAESSEGRGNDELAYIEGSESAATGFGEAGHNSGKDATSTKEAENGESRVGLQKTEHLPEQAVGLAPADVRTGACLEQGPPEADVGSEKVDPSILFGKYIPHAASTEPFLLPEVCPSLPLQMAMGNRIVTIVTTAALPWFTGTAINPLLRAAYLALNRGVLVTLMVPWLEVEDQKMVYPAGMIYTRKQEQEEHMRNWLWDRLRLPVHFRIAFYPAVFDLLKFGIFPTQKIDITELVPRSERDVVILEEPEHLSWFNYQGKWRSKFRLSVGVAHTNYMEYLRRQAGEAFPPVIPLMWILNVLLVRANCHKVIRLSRGVQWFCNSVVCNVHGVSPNFMEIGDRVRDRALSLLEDGFSSEDEACSAPIQPDAGARTTSGAAVKLQERRPDKEGPQRLNQEGADKEEEGYTLWGHVDGQLWESGGEREGQVHDAGQLSSSDRPTSVRGGFEGMADGRGKGSVAGRQSGSAAEERGRENAPWRAVNSSSSSVQSPTSVLWGPSGRGFEKERERELTVRPSTSSGGVEVSTLGGGGWQRGTRSVFTGGCYFIGRAIWGKGYHELCQLLKKQKEDLEAAGGQTRGGERGAGKCPKHKLVQLEDLEGHELRPGGEKVDPQGGALPLVQEPGGSHTFRLLNLCMRSRLLWQIQAMWLRTRYGERLKWLEHGRRAFCALQNRGEKAQPGEAPGKEALERVHSTSGQVNSIVDIEQNGVPARREVEIGKSAGDPGSRRGLAELIHIDCYGTGPHEGKIGAFSKEHGLPLAFHGRIDHKELPQYKVYVNPAISDVVCTATAEALAMGKFAVIANHRSNEFFIENFPGNCITFESDDPNGFLWCLHFALAHQPAPLTPEQRRLLTWEAATERFMQAAGL